MQTHVSLAVQEQTGYLTLACDEPGKPPTLDLQVLDELDVRLAELQAAGQDVRAMVVRSDAEKYFCVGANIHALRRLDAATIVPWVERGHAVFNRLAALPLPVIALVEGYALGGGLELALACDLIVAAGTARLGQPEARLGLVAGWGGSLRLPRRVGMGRAKELFFSGRMVAAEEALDMGLVDYVGDGAAVREHLASLLAGIGQCSPLAVAQMKRLIDGSSAMTLRAACEQEAAASRLCLSSEDTQARVASYLEGRKT